ncbi:SDR family oxidoreductase [Urechidicola croceus]|uniref:Short-chain dehydrogenase n=1 Tax=Urechidicola croceus TaxID=1850246 RepID=A0A1D8P9Z1_9FLAO|nr:SDR family oxidoreductase [Urechidicola croceus]AOW21311.1 short-chain dehydrogenase [Urechidicola croceus]
MTLKDKVIWITGASSGIGKSLAIELSKLDTKLILSSRKKNILEEVKQLCEHPENVKIVTLDLEDYMNFSKIVEEAITAFGKIDILVNNGGISQRALAIDTNITTDKKIMDINYMGTMALTKTLLPHFIKNNSGHFVTVTSVVGKVATPVRSSYSASKHALHGFFDSLRAEVYKNNISVTLICPGYVRTNISMNAVIGDGSKQNKMDTATDKGISPDVFAKKMIRVIEKRKNEVTIGGTKEIGSVILKRLSPKLLAKLVRKVNVT